MARREIVLENIKHREIHFSAALGIREEELIRYIKILQENYTPLELMKVLNTNVSELREIINEILIRNQDCISKAVVAFWEKRKKKKVSLLKCIGTYLLIHWVVERRNLTEMLVPKEIYILFLPVPQRSKTKQSYIS